MSSYHQIALLEDKIIECHDNFITDIYYIDKSKIDNIHTKALFLQTHRIRRYKLIKFNNKYIKSYLELKTLIHNINKNLSLYVKALKQYVQITSYVDPILKYICKNKCIFYTYKIFKKYMNKIRTFNSYYINRFKFEGYFKTILHNIYKLITIIYKCTMCDNYLNYIYMSFYEYYDEDFVNINGNIIRNINNGIRPKYNVIVKSFRHTPLIKLIKLNDFKQYYLRTFEHKHVLYRNIIKYLKPVLSPEKINKFYNFFNCNKSLYYSANDTRTTKYKQTIIKISSDDITNLKKIISYIKQKKSTKLNLMFDKFFVKNKVNYDKYNKYINTIIYLLIKNKYTDKADYLLKKYSELQDNNPNIQETILYAAVCDNNYNIVKFLMDKGYKYNYPKTDFKNSLLYISMNNKNQEISMELINNSHQYDYPKCNFYETALRCALQNKLYTVVEFMINNNVRLNYPKNHFKNTPLSYAIHTKNEKIIEMIINKGVKIDYPNISFINTPLYKSIVYKLTNTSLLLINKGVRINYRNIDFIKTPLYFSIKNELEPVSLLLIDKGVKVRYRNIQSDIETPLGVAQYYGPPSIVSKLCEKGCLNDLMYVIENKE